MNDKYVKQAGNKLEFILNETDDKFRQVMNVVRGTKTYDTLKETVKYHHDRITEVNLAIQTKMKKPKVEANAM